MLNVYRDRNLNIAAELYLKYKANLCLDLNSIDCLCNNDIEGL